MLPVICFYRLEITFDGDVMNGVACNLQSRGYHALCKATKEIVGHVEPYSITGSLPLIRELQVWELMRKLTFWALSPWTKANSLSNFYRTKDLMLKQLDMVSAYISKKTNSFLWLLVFIFLVSPASNVTVHVHLMLLLLSRRLTEDIPREEWILPVFRHGPGFSGVSEHHFTAGRRGLSLLAGIDQYLQFKLLVAQWHGHLTIRLVGPRACLFNVETGAISLSPMCCHCTVAEKKVG